MTDTRRRPSVAQLVGVAQVTPTRRVACALLAGALTTLGALAAPPVGAAPERTVPAAAVADRRPAAPAPSPERTMSDRIAARLPLAQLPGTSRPVSSAERQIVRAVYAAAAGPRWIAPAPPFRASASASDAIAQLATAERSGLRPSDYPVAWLRDRAARALPADEAAQFDLVMTLASARYLTDLGFGRIDPSRLGFELPAQRRATMVGAVATAIGSGASLAKAAAAVQPAVPLYPKLIDALARYRRIASAGPWPVLPVPNTRVAPGDPYAGLRALRLALLRTGDLVEPDDVAADAPYAEPTVGAVRRFQARHGLTPDGVLGNATLQALKVPPARRVRQIELSLERLRWLGRLPAERYIAINLPEFRLWAVPGPGETGEPLEMNVIVGATMTHTPVFTDTVVAIEVHPYWNVPPSIAVKELYPKLAADPGALARADMELLGGSGLSGVALEQALASGSARIRQRPGDKNALGRLKFVMPNRHSIYLHDTPGRQLFARSRRDFSHGCIRLERPLALAQFVLRGRSDWDIDQVMQAVAAGRNQRVPLSQPVPVLILYSTVNVGSDGTVKFLPDLYQLDDRLQAALDRT